MITLGARDVVVKGDSQLVIRQLIGQYSCLNSNMMTCFTEALSLIRQFDDISFEYIPRLENEIANELAQKVSGYKLSVKNLDALCTLSQRLPLQGMDIYSLTLAGQDWRQPIIDFLENPNINVDRKIKLRSIHYVLCGGDLFKKSSDGTLLKCLGESESRLAMAEIHDGICGAHQAGDKMKWILSRYKYFWPTMIKDCYNYAKSCENCQVHGVVQHMPASELHSIIKPWPFRGWALDIIGQIHPPSSKGHKYILVAVDYFTKWVEAVPFKEIDQQDVINFIEEQIIYRFGIPETLTTDQGSVFIGKKVLQYANEMKIKMLRSTPYYAQANGQVEAMNKIIVSLIKKHVGKKPKSWHETLSQILWAYRNSPRESTGVSPYRLTYSHDSVLPVEINLMSVRVQRQNELPTQDYWSMMFDELDQLDEERLLACENIIRQKEKVAKFYNKKVKAKVFSEGDLVWKVILPLDIKSKTLGKWSPNWQGPFKVVKVLSNNSYMIEEVGGLRLIKSINGKYLKKFRPSIYQVPNQHLFKKQ